MLEGLRKEFMNEEEATVLQGGNITDLSGSTNIFNAGYSNLTHGFKSAEVSFERRDQGFGGEPSLPVSPST